MAFSFFCSERGAEYEFRISANNAVDYGEPATDAIRTPDGCKYCNSFTTASSLQSAMFANTFVRCEGISVRFML